MAISACAATGALLGDEARDIATAAAVLVGFVFFLVRRLRRGSGH
jgi:hypothetical protein